MDIQQSCFSGVMLAVGKLVGIEKTVGDKVISKSIVSNNGQSINRSTEIIFSVAKTAYLLQSPRERSTEIKTKMSGNDW